MTTRTELMRALWFAAKANGGTLRIGPSVQQNYPGDDRAFVTTAFDKNFGELIIVAHDDGVREDGKNG